MTKNIACQPLGNKEAKTIKIRVIKAPLVDTQQLRRILLDRSRALVL